MISRGSRCRHGGFTIIELLVTVSIIGLLIALLLPAVQAVREASRRTSCQNNLKQLGLALHNFQSSRGAFPASKIAARGSGLGECELEEIEVEDNPGKCSEHQSWTASCLPFIEQADVADLYHFDQPWSTLRNRPAVMTRLQIFLCPSVPDHDRYDYHYVRGAAATDYAAINQVEVEVYTDVFGVPDPGMVARRGALAEHVLNPPRQIIDGLSKTIMLAECAGRPYSYVFGRPMTAEEFATYTDDEVIAVDGQYIADDGVGWADPESGSSIKGVSENGLELFGPRMINVINASESYAFHQGGAFFLFADGSIRFLNEDIDPWVYVSLCTRAGSEVVDEF